MKINPGIVAVDLSGKQAGSVASKNAYALFLRKSVSPINRNTPAQSAIRSSFSVLSTNWSQLLTESERGAWIGFSLNHQFSMTFGVKRSLKGKEMYIKINQVLANAGLATITDPPTDLSTGEIGRLALIASSAGAGTLTLTTNEAGVPGTAYINIYATPLVNNGRNSVSSLTRYLGTFPSGGSPYDIKALWIAKYGAFPTTAGQKIAVLAQVITDQGWAGQPATTASFVV